jgi:hypothetical protein
VTLTKIPQMFQRVNFQFQLLLSREVLHISLAPFVFGPRVLKEISVSKFKEIKLAPLSLISVTTFSQAKARSLRWNSKSSMDTSSALSVLVKILIRRNFLLMNSSQRTSSKTAKAFFLAFDNLINHFFSPLKQATEKK